MDREYHALVIRELGVRRNELTVGDIMTPARQVEGCARMFAIADEDLERENEDKTSAVHFARFELDESMCGALKGGAGLSIGIDHPNYSASVVVAPEVRRSLAGDLH